MPVGAQMLLGLLAVLVPGSSWAALTWNFPPSATPLVLDTLHVHNPFMLFPLAIFFIVFAIMIYSIFAHRKSRGYEFARFIGSSTAAQVFWTTIPFLVFTFTDFVLMGIPACHSVQLMQDASGSAEMTIKATGSQWKYPDEGVKFVSALATDQGQVPNRAGCFAGSGRKR